MRPQIYANANAAYVETLRTVWENPMATSAPRGLPIREWYNYSFLVAPRPTPIVEPIAVGDPDRDAQVAAYTMKEFELYSRMTDRAEEFAKASKFWNGIANPDGTVNSAYGKLIFMEPTCGDPPMESIANGLGIPHHQRLRTPFEWAILSLLADPDSRQAFIRVNLPRHQWWGNKDQVCTMHLYLRIRPPAGIELHSGDPETLRLDMSVVMRSNDVIKGLTYDMPYFMWVQERAVEALAAGRDIPYGPRESLVVRSGLYFHLAHSMHVYDRDAELVERILNAAKPHNGVIGL